MHSFRCAMCHVFFLFQLSNVSLGLGSPPPFFSCLTTLQMVKCFGIDSLLSSVQLLNLFKKGCGQILVLLQDTLIMSSHGSSLLAQRVKKNISPLSKLGETFQSADLQHLRCYRKGKVIFTTILYCQITFKMRFSSLLFLYLSWLFHV